MAKLFWLKTIQPCKLELRPLTDYAGQPLIFTTPGTSFSRRCVTEEVRRSTTVETYIARQIIADETPILVTIAAPPVVKQTTPTPTPVPVVTAPVVNAEAEITEPIDVNSTETVIPNELTTKPVETPEAEGTSDTRRSRRNRGRY